MTFRVVVLASGTGSLFASLVQATQDTFEITALITDNSAAGALAIADRAGVTRRTVALADYADRAAWDQALATGIAEFRPDLVVSAGFMRVLGPAVLATFPQRIINTHPALLPLFPGAHAVRDALAAGVSVTGSTVHVVDAGVDTGPVIAQETVAVLPQDDEAALHERIKSVERRLLLDVVTRIAKHGFTVHDRKVSIA